MDLLLAMSRAIFCFGFLDVIRVKETQLNSADLNVVP